MKTIKKLMVCINAYRRKPRNPDKIFAILTTSSWGLRIAITFIIPEKYLPYFFEPGLIKISLLPKILTVETQAIYLVSIILTFFFIFFCHFFKVDWYGKEKLGVISALRRWSKEKAGREKFFVLFLCFFDPFLFYFSFINGVKKIIKKILAWPLLCKSLFLNSLLWLGIGLLQKSIGILPFIALIIAFFYGVHLIYQKEKRRELVA